jgi:hypothetical protein
MDGMAGSYQNEKKRKEEAFRSEEQETGPIGLKNLSKMQVASYSPVRSQF